MNGWLQVPYSQQREAFPQCVEIVDKILETRQDIPYRRRNFEANAMAKEIMKRAAVLGFEWGHSFSIATNKTSILDMQHRNDRESKDTEPMRLLLISSPKSSAMRDETAQTLRKIGSKDLVVTKATDLEADDEFFSAIEKANRILLFLSSDSLLQNSVQLRRLSTAIAHVKRARCRDAWPQMFEIFYDPEEWIFHGAAHMGSSDDFKSLISCRECFVYRSRNAAHGNYEHIAVLGEFLRRAKALV